MANRCVLITSGDLPVSQLIQHYLQDQSIDVILIEDVMPLSSFPLRNEIGLIIINDAPNHLDAIVVAKEIQRISKAPILILLATVRPDRANIAYSMGVDYLVKPFDREEFIGFIRCKFD